MISAIASLVKSSCLSKTSNLCRKTRSSRRWSTRKAKKALQRRSCTREKPVKTRLRASIWATKSRGSRKFSFMSWMQTPTNLKGRFTCRNKTKIQIWTVKAFIASTLVWTVLTLLLRRNVASCQMINLQVFHKARETTKYRSIPLIGYPKAQR